jgi:hypothetical protein
LISQELLPFIWIATGVSIFLLLILALALRKEMGYHLGRMAPWNRKSVRRAPGNTSIVVWAAFLGMVVSTAAGAGVLTTYYQGAEVGEVVEQHFTLSIPLPTPSPVPTLAPITSPVEVAIRFPQGLDPCNVDALTLIPAEVDPYALPIVQPIDPWFAEHRFLQTAFADVRVNNRIRDADIQLAQQVLVRVNQHEALPGPLDAAFTVCDSAPPRFFPTVELTAPDLNTAIRLGEAEFLTLRPGENHHMEIKLVGIEPGLYEVSLGIEYTHRGQVHQVWANDTLLVSVPEVMRRWSAGVITYWGDCALEDGAYHCEEYELQEPILVQPVDPDQPEDPDVPVVETCPIAPPQRMAQGMQAEVSYRLGLRLRFRSEPGYDGHIETSMPRGTRLTVIGGPLCQDGYWWWNVQIQSTGARGWMAEGEPRVYYLDPLE